nr:aminotransferase class IV [Pontibacter ruber]
MLYNGHIILEDELQLPLSNRAFQYNDGFFETLMMRNGKLLFWQDHVARMKEAAKVLKLELPPLFSQAGLEEELQTLAHCNNTSEYGRIKLKVWRAGGGLYTPETNAVDWYATVIPAAPVATEPLQIGICKNVRTIPSSLSHFKGPNALLYVLAGIEKQERQFNDMLLLDQQDNVSELISSNIFWIKDAILYTPALTAGCVNGIVRRNILRWCQAQRINLQEGKYSKDSLLQADTVFCSNVTGVRPIAAVEDVKFEPVHPLLTQLQQHCFPSEV